MIGYKLTIEQAELLFGQTFDGVSKFNPTQDISGDYFIFEGEVKNCTQKEFEWVKDLKKFNFIPYESEKQ